jgi:methyl-accepting chemotaxis protein
MSWKCGSGLSSKPSGAAAAEAAREALEALAGAPPTFGLVFASPQQDLAAAISAVSGATGCKSLIGCTAAGEITERGLVQGGVSTMLVSAPEAVHSTAFARDVNLHHLEAARLLCAGFAEAAARANTAGFPHSTTVTLVDGLVGMGEKLVKQIMLGTRPFQQVVGGAAGDEAARETRVADLESCGTSCAAVMHVFGARRWGVGVDHGLKQRSNQMVVTRAEGNVVRELDHQPAFEAYRSYARSRGVTLEPATAGNYFLANELGVFFLGQFRCARSPLRVTTDGGLVCAADIPQGSIVAILDGEVDSMLAAAGRAAAEAKDNLGGAEPAGVLLFDCVGRHALLGSAFPHEIEAVRAAFPGVPVAGFLTFGEIARYRGRLDGWHNTTAVVVAIPR